MGPPGLLLSSASVESGDDVRALRVCSVADALGHALGAFAVRGFGLGAFGAGALLFARLTLGERLLLRQTLLLAGELRLRRAAWLCAASCARTSAAPSWVRRFRSASRRSFLLTLTGTAFGKAPPG